MCALDLSGSSRFLRLFAFVIAPALVVLEALGLHFWRHNMLVGWEVVFFFYFLFYGLFPISLYFWRIKTAVSLRRHWILLWIGVLLNFAALMWRGGLFYNLIKHGATGFTGTNYTDLLIILAMTPNIIMVSLPNGKPYPSAFFWIDSVQILVLSYLIYLKLFGVIPFTHRAIYPLPTQTVATMILVLNASLCCLAFFRFLGALTPDERRFWRLYSVCGVLNLIVITMYNRFAASSDYATYYELSIALGTYILLFLVLSLPRESEDGATVNRTSKIAQILNIVCPAFFTLSLMAMGIDISRHFFRFGLGAITVAFVLYVVRSTILQRIYELSRNSLQEARDKLEAIALTDVLTGVANRRCFDRTLEAEWARAVRTQDPLSLLMIDIDFFKQLNDNYGHQAGDACLKQIADALHGCLPRSGDLLARYGGEEFAVILPITSLEGARRVATKMQEAVHHLVLEREAPMGVSVTISIGTATCVFPTDCGPLEFLQVADRALYHAKENGRNRVEVGAMSKPYMRPKLA